MPSELVKSIKTGCPVSNCCKKAGKELSSTYLSYNTPYTRTSNAVRYQPLPSVHLQQRNTVQGGEKDLQVLGGEGHGVG